MSAAAKLNPPFPQCIGAVARQLWCPPNKALSSATEMRFGARGSKSVDLVKNTWFDHERGVGGGVLELVMLEMKADKAGAVKWLEQNKHIQPKAGAPKPVKPAVATPRTIVTTYPYTDDYGEQLFEVVRYDPKDFRQRRPDGRGGWIWNLDGVPEVPFRLPELLDGIRRGVTVFLCEGEKDTLAVAALGLVATTIRGGANKWHADLAQYFDGAHVVILPHNDLPGTTHAAKITAELAGVAATIRTIKLSGLTKTGADAFDWIEAGGTAEALQALVDAVEPPDPDEPPPPNSEYDYGETGPAPDDDEPAAEAKATPFRIESPAAWKLEDEKAYVWKGMIGAGDNALLIGHPSAGKSVLAPALAYAIAQGRHFLGRRTTQGPVIYIAAEDGAGMRRRMSALYAQFGEAPHLHHVPDALDLMDINGPAHAALEALIQQVTPRAVVIDTLAKSFPGLQENEAGPTGMPIVVRVVRGLAALTDAAVLTLHHLPKDGTTARGHGSLGADADVVLVVEGAKAEPRTIKLLKNRNGPSDACFTFELTSAHLGIDHDGDPVSAPILREITVDEAQAGARQAEKGKRERRLGDKAQDALRIIRNVSIDLGEMATPVSGMPPVRAFRRADLRNALINEGCFPEGTYTPGWRPNLSPELTGGGSPLNREGGKIENNILTSLRAKGFIGFHGDLVWLA